MDIDPFHSLKKALQDELCTGKANTIIYLGFKFSIKIKITHFICNLK